MGSQKQGKTFKRQEVSQHSKPDSLWTIIDSSVYDLSSFVEIHPGGAAVLLGDDVAGKDSTTQFFGLHRSAVLKKYQRLKIGDIEGEKGQVVTPEDGALSTVPYGEPGFLNSGWHSPYYKQSHRDLQKEVSRLFESGEDGVQGAHSEIPSFIVRRLFHPCGTGQVLL